MQRVTSCFSKFSRYNINYTVSTGSVSEKDILPFFPNIACRAQTLLFMFFLPSSIYGS